MSLAYLQILRQLPEDWCFLEVLFHNHFWMWASSVLKICWALQGQATNEGREHDNMGTAEELQEAAWRHCSGHSPSADVRIARGRVTDMAVQLLNKAFQMNSFCSDCVLTKTSVAPLKVLVRPEGTETICASLRRSRFYWSRDSRPKYPKY